MLHFRYKVAGALVAILLIAVGFAALRDADERWNSGLFSLTLGFLLGSLLLAVHRTGERRAFWIGFALFGWVYLGLALIPSIEARLISSKAIASLHQFRIFFPYANRVRITLDLDLLRDNKLSPEHILQATQPTTMISSTDPRQTTVLERSADGSILVWESSDAHPNQFADIIIRATPDGDTLRLKDVAQVETAGSSAAGRVWTSRTAEDFRQIGHTLVTWLVAGLGGVISRRLGRSDEVRLLPG